MTLLSFQKVCAPEPLLYILQWCTYIGDGGPQKVGALTPQLEEIQVLATYHDRSGDAARAEKEAEREGESHGER